MSRKAIDIEEKVESWNCGIEFKHVAPDCHAVFFVREKAGSGSDAEALGKSCIGTRFLFCHPKNGKLVGQLDKVAKSWHNDAVVFYLKLDACSQKKV